MIFKRRDNSIDEVEEVIDENYEEEETVVNPDDNVDTVVGPSMNVEGDFSSEGNIIVKGTVTGSVTTSKHLIVEQGAKIIANVNASSATVAGEVRGNMKVKDYIELVATARVVGDIEVQTISMEPGALLYGKVNMPGLEKGKGTVRSSGRSTSRSKKTASVENNDVQSSKKI